MEVKSTKDYLSMYCRTVFFSLLVYLVAGFGYLFFVRTTQLNHATVAQGRLLSLVKEQRALKPNLTSEDFRGRVNKVFEDNQQLLQVVSFRDEASENILNRFRRASYDDSQLDVSTLRRSVLYAFRWDYVNLPQSNRVISIESVYYVLPQNLIYQVVQFGFFLCIFFFLVTVLLLLFYPSRRRAMFKQEKVTKDVVASDPLFEPLAGDTLPGESDGRLGGADRPLSDNMFDAENGPEDAEDTNWLEKAFDFDELGGRASSAEREGSVPDDEPPHEEWDLDFSQLSEIEEPPVATQDPPPSEDPLFTPEERGENDFSFEDELSLSEENFELPEIPRAPHSLMEDDVGADLSEEPDLFADGEEIANLEESGQDLVELSEHTGDELFDFLGEDDLLSENSENVESGSETVETTLSQSEDWGLPPETPEMRHENLVGGAEDDIFLREMEEPNTEADEDAVEDEPTETAFELEPPDGDDEFSPDALPVSNVDDADFSDSFETQLPPVDREPELSELFDSSEEGDPQFDDAGDVWESVLTEQASRLNARLSALLDQEQPFSLVLLTAGDAFGDVLRRSFDESALLLSDEHQAVLLFPGLALPQALEELQNFAGENTLAGLRCGLSGYVATRVGLDAETLLEEARYAWLSTDAEKPIGAYSGV